MFDAGRPCLTSCFLPVHEMEEWPIRWPGNFFLLSWQTTWMYPSPLITYCAYCIIDQSNLSLPHKWSLWGVSTCQLPNANAIPLACWTGWWNYVSSLPTCELFVRACSLYCVSLPTWNYLFLLSTLKILTTFVESQWIVIRVFESSQFMKIILYWCCKGKVHHL